ncbi:MAG: membrane integrity-associated transporter subunit PqiC [Opitutales bacterium]
MKRRVPFVSYSALLPLLLLAGCLGLEPASDPSRFFTLVPEATAAGAPTVLEVRVVEAPDYLRSKQMAIREGAHEIVYESFWRWTGPTDVMLAQRVALRLGAKWGEEAPRGKLSVRLRRFEGTSGGEAVLAADWTFHPDGEGSPTEGNFAETRSWTRRQDPSALVSALGELTDALAASIAGQL